MDTRADRIETILRTSGRQLRVSEITERLQEQENTDLNQSTVSATVLQDNRTREGQGVAPRFNTYGDGTAAWGRISLRLAQPTPSTPSVPARTLIPDRIEQENAKVRTRLKEDIQDLYWREFESNFLLLILDALGFHEIQLTQATRDGGIDAYCRYRRGLVASEVIVSAKHWKTKDVAADEIQRLRGIKGPADTGVIITSSTFSEGAKKEAEPSQNQRAIVLIDGDLIVTACLGSAIGVERIVLPQAFRFVGFAAKDAEQ